MVYGADGRLRRAQDHEKTYGWTPSSGLSATAARSVPDLARRGGNNPSDATTSFLTTVTGFLHGSK